MSVWTKIKLGLALLLAGAIAVGVFIIDAPFVQKKIFDYKADLVGTNRVVTFYSNIDAKQVASYQDIDTRFETLPDGSISVWLGSQNKKVKSNMNYIIEDIK